MFRSGEKRQSSFPDRGDTRKRLRPDDSARPSHGNTFEDRARYYDPFHALQDKRGGPSHPESALSDQVLQERLQEQYSSRNQDNQGNPSRKILIEKWKSYIIEHIRNGTAGELWNGVAESSPQVQAYFQDAIQELSKQGESAKGYILEASSLQAGSSESHVQEVDLPLSTGQIEQYKQRQKFLEAFIDPKKQEERQRSDQAGSSHWQKQKERIERLSDSALDDSNTEKDWKAISIELNANAEDIEQIRQQFKKYKKIRKASHDSASDSEIARSFITSLPERYRQAYSEYRDGRSSQEGQAIYQLWSEVYTTLPWEEDQKIVEGVRQLLDQRDKEWLEKNKNVEEHNKYWKEMAQKHSEKQG